MNYRIHGIFGGDFNLAAWQILGEEISIHRCHSYFLTSVRIRSIMLIHIFLNCFHYFYVCWIPFGNFDLLSNPLKCVWVQSILDGQLIVLTWAWVVCLLYIFTHGLKVYIYTSSRSQVPMLQLLCTFLSTGLQISKILNKTLKIDFIILFEFLHIYVLLINIS